MRNSVDHLNKHRVESRAATKTKMFTMLTMMMMPMMMIDSEDFHHHHHHHRSQQQQSNFLNNILDPSLLLPSSSSSSLSSASTLRPMFSSTSASVTNSQESPPLRPPSPSSTYPIMMLSGETNQVRNVHQNQHHTFDEDERSFGGEGERRIGGENDSVAVDDDDDNTISATNSNISSLALAMLLMSSASALSTTTLSPDLVHHHIRHSSSSSSFSVPFFSASKTIHSSKSEVLQKHSKRYFRARKSDKFMLANLSSSSSSTLAYSFRDRAPNETMIMLTTASPTTMNPFRFGETNRSSYLKDQIQSIHSIFSTSSPSIEATLPLTPISMSSYSTSSSSSIRSSSSSTIWSPIAASKIDLSDGQSDDFNKRNSNNYSDQLLSMAMAIIQNNNGGVNDDYLSDLSGDADSGDDGADQSAYYQTLLITIIFGMIMVFTIVGNIMVIYAIFNYRPLHNVQNMFMVSLAVADIAVAVLVMPFNLAYNLLDRWIFGLHLCEMWLTSDV